MKHRLLFLLSLCLLVICLIGGTALSVSAAKAGTVTVESLTVPAGTGTVTLKIALADNPGMINLKLELGYDSDHFVLKTVSDGKLFKDFTTTDDKAANPFVMVWSDDLATTNTTANGTLVTLTFTVLSGTPENDYIFSLSCKDPYDKDLNTVSISPVNGTVTIGCVHQYGAWKTEKAATIQAEGLEKRVCTLCGHEETRTVPKLKDTHTHTFNGLTETVKAPTCAEEGTLRTHCSFEGCTAYEDTPIAKLEHTVGDWIEETPAVCEIDGRKIKTCTVCGSVVEEEILPKLEHVPGEFVIGTLPDCTHKGTQTQSCTVCGKLLKTEELPAKGHEYTDVVTAPGCFTAGKTTRTCSVCGAVETTDEKPAIGYHTVENWTVVKESGKDTAGEKTGVCTVCGKTVTVITAPLTESITEGTTAVTGKNGTLMPENLQILLTDRTNDEAAAQAAEAAKTVDACKDQTAAAISELKLTVQDKTTEQEPVRPEVFAADGEMSIKIAKPAGLSELKNVHLVLVDDAGSAREIPFTDNGDGTVTVETSCGGWLVFTGDAPATPAPTEAATPAPTAKPHNPGRKVTPTKLIFLLCALILALVLLALVIIRRKKRR